MLHIQFCVYGLLRSWLLHWPSAIKSPAQRAPPSAWRCLLQGGTVWRTMEPLPSLKPSRYRTNYCLSFEDFTCFWGNRKVSLNEECHITLHYVTTIVRDFTTAFLPGALGVLYSNRFISDQFISLQLIFSVIWLLDHCCSKLYESVNVDKLLWFSV